MNVRILSEDIVLDGYLIPKEVKFYNIIIIIIVVVIIIIICLVSKTA